MAVLCSPSSAQNDSGRPNPFFLWNIVVREFTREQHRQIDEASVGTVRYPRIGMWVLLDPERAPEGVDDAGWLWARIRSSMVVDEVTFGWIHPEKFRQLQ